MKKSRYLFVVFFMLIVLISVPVEAAKYEVDSSYETYVYNSTGEPIVLPQAYTVARSVTGSNKGFNNLSDVFYDGVGKVYICDKGNNRILVADYNFNITSQITDFIFEESNQTFDSPEGIWANENSLYVADTGNNRIVYFKINNDNYVVNKIYTKPDIPMLDDEYVFSPTQLTVDFTGNMYVLASGINQGIICLDNNGTFQGFMGAPKVEPNIFEALWRKIATKEQLEKMDSYVPTEYNSILMDAYGFFYVTSETSNDVPVAKLNSDGDNILAEPKTKLWADKAYYLDTSGYRPCFTDVALCSSGEMGEDIFFVLDSDKGKIYAYTEDSYMLYAFGGIGNQRGVFYNASAIEYIKMPDGRGRLVVADSFKGIITIFDETDFSVKIRRAMQLYSKGNYDAANEAWKDVLNIASGYTYAQIELAQIKINEKNYLDAMDQLIVLKEQDMYAEAFEGARDNFIRNNFIWIALSLIVLCSAIAIVTRILRKKHVYRKIASNQLIKGYRYANYVILHPFDGFWDLKREKRGNIKSALLIIGLFFVLYSLRIQFCGYIVMGTTISERNVLYHVAMMFLPLAFYVISNWCFTSLMDGKGNMKDIIIATAYALKPYVIFAIPMLLISNILIPSELAFYTFFDTVIWGWVIFLLFAGIMMTHDYSLSKTLLSIVLILIGICLIIFIILLVISIVQNFYQFVYNSYQELSLRSY